MARSSQVEESMSQEQSLQVHSEQETEVKDQGR